MRRGHGLSMPRFLVISKNGAAAPSLPYSVDFSVLPDGDLPAEWVGATWAIASGEATNTPGAGGELLNNPGFEGTYSSGLAPNFSKYPAGSVVSESADVHGGSAAQSLGNATGNQGSVYGTEALTAGNWVRFASYIKNVSGNARLSIAQLFGGALTLAYKDFSGLAAYTQKIINCYIPDTGNHNIGHVVGSHAVAGTNTALFDDSSLTVLTLANLTANLDRDYSGVAIAKASVTVGALGAVVGIVGWWDGVAPFQNCIVAYTDGALAYLAKFVGTTRTLLTSGAAVHPAAGDIEIRRLAGTNTFQLWDNGSQVGTNQTVNDAAIINNKRFCLFSTGDGSTGNAFFLD